MPHEGRDTARNSTGKTHATAECRSPLLFHKNMHSLPKATRPHVG